MAKLLNREVAGLSDLQERGVTLEAQTAMTAAGSVARVGLPSFTYRGYGDPHWRGQGCSLIGPSDVEQRAIVLACGCHANVPWWTLEPVE